VCSLSVSDLAALIRSSSRICCTRVGCGVFRLREMGPHCPRWRVLCAWEREGERAWGGTFGVSLTDQGRPHSRRRQTFGSFTAGCEWGGEYNHGNKVRRLPVNGASKRHKPRLWDAMAGGALPLALVECESHRNPTLCHEVSNKLLLGLFDPWRWDRYVVPETSVKDYRSTLCNIPWDRSSYLINWFFW
jgi:hypothetical protein